MYRGRRELVSRIHGLMSSKSRWSPAAEDRVHLPQTESLADVAEHGLDHLV
jgi:hypothetical protein